MVNKSQQAVCWLMPTSYHASLYLAFPKPCACLHWVFAPFWAVMEDKGEMLSAAPWLGRAAAWQLLRAPSWDQGPCLELQGQLYLAWLFLRYRLTGGMKSICPPPLAAHSWCCVGHGSGSSKTVLERRCMLWVLGTLLPLWSPLSSASIFPQYFLMAFSDSFLHKNN